MDLPLNDDKNYVQNPYTNMKTWRVKVETY